MQLNTDLSHAAGMAASQVWPRDVGLDTGGRLEHRGAEEVSRHGSKAPSATGQS